MITYYNRKTRAYETEKVAGDRYLQWTYTFCKNKREWSMFHSKHYDNILHVEVGATCVGSIIQTYAPKTNVSKGCLQEHPSP